MKRAIAVPAKARYKTPYAVLKAAAKLLSSKKHWTQNELAVDCKGHSCKPRSGKAIAVCAMGAVQLVDGPSQNDALKILTVAAGSFNMKKPSLATLAELDVEGDFSDDTIFDVNDDSSSNSYSNVKRMFRRAIAYAKDRNFLAKLEAAVEKLEAAEPGF